MRASKQSGKTLEIGSCDGDASTEPSVHAEVFELLGLVGSAVKPRFEFESPVNIPILEFVRPDRVCLDNERFTVRVEFVRHDRVVFRELGCHRRVYDPADAVERRVRISGKLVIGVILAVAVAAATFSWHFRWQATRRAAEFWGPEAVAAIQQPRRVDAFLLCDSPLSAGAKPAGSERLGEMEIGAFQIIAREDVTNAPGLTHFRNALLEDRSFDWSDSKPSALPIGYGLRFRPDGGGRDLLVFFSKDFKWLTRKPVDSSGPSGASTAPIADGMRKYFADVFPVD